LLYVRVNRTVQYTASQGGIRKKKLNLAVRYADAVVQDERSGVVSSPVLLLDQSSLGAHISIIP
jgi:hypothetical protein